MGIFKLGKMTFGSLFKKPETLLYPFEVKTPPKDLKGVVALDADKCGLCGICEKRCPCNSITIDKGESTWTINHYSCVQCGSCVRDCTKDCLYMLPKTPLATASFTPEVVFVPNLRASKKEKQEKSEAQAENNAQSNATIEPTGDAEMDAKLAKMDPERALKVRAAFMAKKKKDAEQQ